MKTCKYCNQEKDEMEFEIALTTPDKVYRRLKCKTCKQATQNIRRQKTRQWYVEYKKSLRCVDCGMTDHRCLEFHHLDNKDRNLADMLTYSIPTIKKEIDKCVVLCANCHRIRHYQELV